MTPGYSPGTPAEPVFTPQGAGASGDRLPGASVPRSPNKRVLPATKEAGVWAADGDPALSADTFTADPLFGVLLPYSLRYPRVDKVLNKCVAGLQAAAEKTGHADVFAALPESVRECMAARAIFFCAETAWNDFVLAQMTYDGNVAYEVAHASAEARKVAADTASAVCAKADVVTALREALEKNAAALADVKAQWKRVEQARQPNQFLR